VVDTVVNPNRQRKKESIMKPSVRALAILAGCTVVLSAGALGASQEQASNGAERIVFEALYDQSDSFYSFACSADGEPVPETDGELIDMEGYIFDRLVFLIDGTNEYHYRMSTMPVGLRGIGVTSGEEFRVKEVDHATGNQQVAGGTGSYRGQLKMVGQNTHRTFWLMYGGHYNIAPDGTVRVSRDRLSTECRPGKE
jgi:hypothetical protein